MNRSPTLGRTGAGRDRSRRRRAVVRGVLAVSVGALATAALLRLTCSTWHDAAPVPGPADAVQVTALGLAALAAGWLTVLLGLTTAGFLPGVFGSWGRRVGALLAPGPCLRLATLLLGAGLTVTSASAPAVAAPAVASVVAGDRAPAPGSVPRTWPDPAFTSPATAQPTRPPHTAPEACLPTPGWQPTGAKVRRNASDVSLLSRCPRDDDPVRWVVHRGDTLWSVAARQLGPDATPAEIARAWPRWYAANREVIGDDPGLILPGQVLTAPREASR